MANEAFALSPISASAALPSDNDYQAISDAFMETTRGRWFLTEYARRNRNADTAMVLAAVARIETTIAAQKQATSTALRAESDEAIRAAIAQARTAATGAVDRFAEASPFAPAQRGLRIIREVAWRLREVGYDSRICDILEAQADAIGACHDPALTHELRAAVVDAFATVERKIEANFEANVEDLAAAGDAVDAGVEATPQAATPEVAQAATIIPDDATVAETASAPEVADVVPDANESVAAPPVVLHLHLATASPVVEADTAAAPEIAVAGDEPTAAVMRASTEPDLTAAPEAMVAAVPEVTVSTVPAAAPPAPIPPTPLSLGESLLARGMVTTQAAKADPLAPIRRMSQAEKIAFFS